jgi:DNA-binding transcriptional LysR family regulator
VETRALVNLNRFDLVSLRLFVAVVDAGSLTAGAERFGISLAAASRRIAELESHCSKALLQRSQRGVTATVEGQAVHRLAIELVANLERLALAVDDMNVVTGGLLRLCANPSALGGFLPAVLAAYAIRHPDVRIDLEDTLSEDAVRLVAAGSAELAVIGDNTPREGLESFVCDVDDVVLITPAGHPLAGVAPVAFERALDYDFVSLNRTASLTRKISAAAEAIGRTLRIRVQARSFDTMCRMVAAGLGLTMLPRAGASLYADALGLKVMALEGLDVKRRLLLVMRSRAALSPAASALVESVEARVRDGVWSD